MTVTQIHKIIMYYINNNTITVICTAVVLYLSNIRMYSIRLQGN